MFVYKTFGVCSRKITFEITDGILHNVRFVGGCNGNTQGVSRLCEGMEAETVIERLRGVDCGGRGTSCPDQLARAVRSALDGTCETC
ncbi:TIGR03905 family TSCPD domain-containing protein [[Clostridium] aminophilum]|uniref:ribonucleoside-diphosphate reductase n=1 Tax=[Clostridium] aminophilum TaxID=1526 RepID=A0A1I0CGN3_9FIRM|nr:TIGR03905 family TSCPD domain-containing protein [[Clostridium] aminophilum]SET18309.1 uncharacterized protein TIGR03905 [[Clostridium] aminophilum]SFR67679.1 uncharacterized protein TIGR03905 [[Clostridium] aminophilum]